MSIEKDLGRIATALEGILAKMNHIGQAVATETPKPAEPAPPPPAATTAPAAPTTPPPAATTAPAAPTTPPPAATTAPAAPTTPPPAATTAPAATAAAPATLTPEELNSALVVEFRRLGKREPIDETLAKFGVSGVTQLEPAQYQPLLDAIRAIQA